MASQEEPVADWYGAHFQRAHRHSRYARRMERALRKIDMESGGFSLHRTVALMKVR